MFTSNVNKLGLAVFVATAFGVAGSAEAAPRDRDVKEARKEVKQARKQVRKEQKDVRKADTREERRDQREDVREAREELRDARGDLREERLENRNGRYYRNGRVFTGNYGGRNYNNGYIYNNNVNNGDVYYSNGRYYRNGQLFTGNYNGYRYVNGVRYSTNNNYNNSYGYGNSNGQVRTFEGVVVVDNGSTNTFVIRTNNGARIRVTAPASQMRGLNQGDVVRVEGRVQGANLFTNNVSIVDNN